MKGSDRQKPKTGIFSQHAFEKRYRYSKKQAFYYSVYYSVSTVNGATQIPSLSSAVKAIQ